MKATTLSVNTISMVKFYFLAAERMPKNGIFSVYDFTRELRRFGLSDRTIASCQESRFKFMLDNFDRISRQLWRRKDAPELPFSEPVQPVTKVSGFTPDDAIKMLKDLGYKIMKPNTGWEEV